MFLRVGLPLFNMSTTSSSESSASFACIATPLGEGGFGAVEGMDFGAGVYIAIKTIIYGRGYHYRELKNEISIMKRLCHRNIVSYIYHDYGKTEGKIFMEWCRAGSLVNHMRTLRMAGPVTEATLLGIFSQVCDAVQHMHSEGITHRDIKPANIFVCSDGTIKMGDFGSATNRPLNSGRVGTRGFCSPEMGVSIYGSEVDIWSLGCLAYWLFTDQLPFKVPCLVEPVNDAAADTDWYTYVRPDGRCSPHVWAIIDSMLQVCPMKRPTIDKVVKRLSRGQPRSLWQTLLFGVCCRPAQV